MLGFLKRWWKKRTPFIPCESTFRNLVRSRNIGDEFDCSNKSGIYCRVLRRNDYEADITVVKTPRGTMHAVVYCEGIYYDPTYGTVTSKLSRIGSYRFAVPFEKLDTWGDEFRCPTMT